MPSPVTVAQAMKMKWPVRVEIKFYAIDPKTGVHHILKDTRIDYVTRRKRKKK